MVLPTHNQRTSTMIPDFKLGPLDESPCDTLNLNNLPEANFRSVRDSVNKAFFDFIDLSYFNPDSWYWEFGDGMTSAEQYPQHEYELTGQYAVCLTVENQYGPSTKCKDVFAERITSTTDPGGQVANVFPNPFGDFIQIDPAFQGVLDVEIYNISGARVMKVELTCPCTIMTASFSPGLYAYRISNDTSMTEGYLLKVK